MLLARRMMLRSKRMRLGSFAVECFSALVFFDSHLGNCVPVFWSAASPPLGAEVL